jgi:hypothetical protein
VARIEWLTYDLFADRVGERFEATPETTAGEPGVTMVLVEATESSEPGGPGPEGQQRRQFSLVFEAPPPVRAQGTFRLEHDDLGELLLFLVPLSADAEGVRYEAAFA